MIAERTTDVQIQSTITGASYAAGIDDENMAHIIGLFTDLYSDQQMAVIREYSTNALDAQIEAGVSGPISVTLPAPLAPFFTVEDRGCGLDATDIQKIYSRYGTSTKRATNDQNGMLGLGCKAALTYTQQFTVESVKNGVRTVCSISRQDGGVPVFTVIASTPTTDANGTKVIVPVNRYHIRDFELKAAEFYSYWPVDAVRINGEPPTPVQGLDLGDGMMIVKARDTYGGQHNRVVMGNVAYPISNDEFVSSIPYSYSLIARVPIGSVTFTPSREALMYTKQTHATLEDLKAGIEAALPKAVQGEVDKSATHREAIQAALRWRELMGRHAPISSFTFQGRTFPKTIDGQFTLVNRKSRSLSQSGHAARGFAVEYAADALFVTGFAPSKFTAQHKRKLLKYAEDNSIDCAYFALTAATTVAGDGWIDDSQIVTWESVRTVKLDPISYRNYGSGRPTGSYDAFVGSVSGCHKHIQAAEIDTNERIFYARSMNKWDVSEAASVIAKWDAKATVVCLPENRYAKFTRNFPDAKNYREGLQQAYDAWASSLTDEVKEALAIHDRGNTNWYKRLDAAKIDDPDLKRAITTFDAVDVAAAQTARRQFDKVLPVINTAGSSAKPFVCPTLKYPLLNELRYMSVRPGAVRDHLYIYLNAAYAASC